MPQGQIAENKVKTTIVMEKTLKTALEKIAKKEHRSFNNLMVSVLSEYAENKGGK